MLSSIPPILFLFSYFILSLCTQYSVYDWTVSVYNCFNFIPIPIYHSHTLLPYGNVRNNILKKMTAQKAHDHFEYFNKEGSTMHNGI